MFLNQKQGVFEGLTCVSLSSLQSVSVDFSSIVCWSSIRTAWGVHVSSPWPGWVLTRWSVVNKWWADLFTDTHKSWKTFPGCRMPCPQVFSIHGFTESSKVRTRFRQDQQTILSSQEIYRLLKLFFFVWEFGSCDLNMSASMRPSHVDYQTKVFEQ